VDAAEFLKSRNPHSQVAVKDLRSDEWTIVAHKGDAIST
jgi:hypothetical protein